MTSIDKKKVAVIGQGYVGTTLAVTLASVGHKVVGVEKNEERLESLKAGDPFFEEPQLEAFIKRYTENDQLRFVHSSRESEYTDSDIFIIGVGTPLKKEEKEPEIDILKGAIESIQTHIDAGDLVILRSTVPIGKSREMLEKIEKETDLKGGEDFHFVFAPERTLQGKAMEEIRNLPQIIGGINEDSFQEAEKLFNDFVGTTVQVSSLEVAEATKLLDNTYRDINIAIGNAFGTIAEEKGFDIWEAIEAANHSYPRNDIFHPGLGVGGGCLPKDPHILLSEFNGDLHQETNQAAEKLIRYARNLNETMPERANEVISRKMKQDSFNSLVLGAAFKGQPPTNDIRHSPSIPVIQELEKKGEVYCYDPEVEDEKIREIGASPIEEAEEAEGVSLIVIANDNPSFREVNYTDIADKDTLIIDGWKMLDKKEMEELGFNYHCIGSGENL